MITLRDFARLGEALGVGEEHIERPAGVADVAALTRWLQNRDDAWRQALADKRLRVAVNPQLTTADAAIGDGDEVAWYPRVTGG
jgi:molybdopterin synthase sulfur carrier subunit